MTEEAVTKLIKRIKTDSTIDGDGQEFIDYLHKLSKDNYEAFKAQATDMNDIHKGYALCVDFLIESFANCDYKVEKTEQDELAEEAYN
jgi:hypothetical protein